MIALAAIPLAFAVVAALTGAYYAREARNRMREYNASLDNILNRV